MSATRSSRKFVFVAGLHRCGTTLLANMLAAHPDISGFKNTGEKMDEGQYLQNVYPSGPVKGGDAVGRLGFDPAAYLTEKSPLAAPEKAELLFSQWAPYWDLSKPVLLEKSPPNLIRMRFLQACFPDSHFIVIARHPVAASVATKKWCRFNPVPGIIANWAMCYGRAARDGERLNSVAFVRYEDLVADPRSVLRPITDRLGISPLPAAPAEVRGDLNRKYFEQWKNLLKDPRERAMAALVRPFAGPVAHRFGYSLDPAE
ncbi:MAG: sulfotransferase [Parvularculaceae bacterium]|nr:sulfotransferase [Parvularculaceae bacterium]